MTCLALVDCAHAHAQFDIHVYTRIMRNGEDHFQGGHFDPQYPVIPKFLHWLWQSLARRGMSLALGAWRADRVSLGLHDFRSERQEDGFLPCL